MHRWMMCPKCGVKLLTIEDEGELIIRECPIDKIWYMTFSGALLKKLKYVTKITGKTLEQLIHDAIMKYSKIKEDNKNEINI